MTSLDQVNSDISVLDFCIRMDGSAKNNIDRALSILCFLNRCKGVPSATAGELAKHIRDSGLGNPNVTTLKSSLKSSKHVLCSGDKLRLKPISIDKIWERIKDLLEPEPPTVPASEEYISAQVWKPSRGFIEKIAIQINGTYHFAYYDGCSVLCRKLIEILLIESFEKHAKTDLVKDTNGDYFMLSGLIDVALSSNGFSIGRESKKILRDH